MTDHAIISDGMHFLRAMLLAVIQGLTEFVPVSSSGHLAVTQYLLGFTEPPVVFDVMLHLGTLVAVLVFYRRDVLSMLRVFTRTRELSNPNWQKPTPRKLMGLLMFACIPTGVMGYYLKSGIEHAFSDVQSIAIGFLISGLIMSLTLLKKKQTRTLAQMNLRDAFLIGAMQGVAIFPGVSRSGSTISTALLLGLNPELAGRFSFLLSIPAILGAALLEAPGLSAEMHSGQNFLFYLASGTVAGVVGYFTLGPMIRILQRARLYYFAAYCWIIGFVLLVYLWQTTM